jgi:hypothetical protein
MLEFIYRNFLAFLFGKWGTKWWSIGNTMKVLLWPVVMFSYKPIHIYEYYSFIALIVAYMLPNT